MQKNKQLPQDTEDYGQVWFTATTGKRFTESSLTRLKSYSTNKQHSLGGGYLNEFIKGKSALAPPRTPAQPAMGSIVSCATRNEVEQQTNKQRVMHAAYAKYFAVLEKGLLEGVALQALDEEVSEEAVSAMQVHFEYLEVVLRFALEVLEIELAAVAAAAEARASLLRYMYIYPVYVYAMNVYSNFQRPKPSVTYAKTLNPKP